MLRCLTTSSSLLRARGPVVTQQASIRRSVEEKLGLPERPKRPLTAFLRFLAQNRENIKAQNPDCQPKDIMAIGGKMWKSASEETKLSLHNEYLREKEKYAERIAKYNANISPKQKEELDEAIEDLKEQKEKREIRLSTSKRNKELGKPVRPLSSYLLFSQSELSNRGNLGLGEFQTVISKKWKALSKEAKDQYASMANKSKEAYEKDLQQWEKKMINKGNLDVVRQKTLDVVYKKKEEGK